jgi:hypothetical protein
MTTEYDFMPKDKLHEDNQTLKKMKEMENTNALERATRQIISK